MVLKAVWVTNLPVKCQKLDIQWPKGRVHSVTYNELIMISFIMVRHRSFAFSVAHQFLYIY